MGWPDAYQQPGCGRGVYARIHVVDEDGKLMVLGSDCYGLAPGEGFVVIQSATHEGCFIAPLPGPFEGWDEALPPSIGEVNTALNVYVSSLPINSLSPRFMSRCKKGSRIDGDPLAIQDFGMKL